MRTRPVLSLLLISFAGSLAAGGCQYIAQINVLEVSNGGSGTGGGTGGGSSSSSSSSTGGLACLADAGNGTCNASSTPPCPACAADDSCPLRCMTQGCPTTMNTTEYAIIVTCDSSGPCTGRDFTCMGSHLCEVDCIDPGSCEGMTLQCDPTGPCRLRCGHMACGSPDAGPDAGPFLSCGGGACDLVYAAGPAGDAPPPVMPKDCHPPCCTQEPTTM